MLIGVMSIGEYCTAKKLYVPALKTRIEKLQNYKRDQLVNNLTGLKAGKMKCVHGVHMQCWYIEKAGDVMTGLDISLKEFAIILSGSIIVWILFNTLIQS